MGAGRPGRSKPAKLDDEALWQFALRALGRRAMSAGEMRQRLVARAESPAAAGRVLGRLEEGGYLDDRRFAEGFATARLENQGFGRQRVLRDLRAKRVAAPVAERAIEEAYRASSEVDMIEQYLARKFRSVQLGEHLADPGRLAAAYRKLRYAGFTAANSIRVLRRYSERADEIEGEDEAADSTDEPAG